MQIENHTLKNNSTEKMEFEHEISIFVIPSLADIDWSNPSVLFKTTLKCFIKAITARNLYTIGHTIVRIKSPKIPEPYYIAMSGKFHTEKVTSVLVRKMGLGVLGATLQGHIEPEKRIKKGMEIYSKRGMIGYIRFKVNEQSIERVTEFIEHFKTKSTLKCSPSELYNGATWPRYEMEGSGCSSFGMAILDVAGILPAGSNEWRVDIKIPMKLIGGEFNGNKKIKIRSILKTTSWFEGKGKEDVGYVRYNVYDPAKIFNWIKKSRTQNEYGYLPENENNIIGLRIDMSHVHVTEPVFLKRVASNLFVKHYYKDISDLIVEEDENS